MGGPEADCLRGGERLQSVRRAVTIEPMEALRSE
jgi:hypothetical protein